MKLDVDTLPTVPAAPPKAGPDRALVEREEEAVAVPLLLLPQAARNIVIVSKRKVTLTNVLSGGDVRLDIFFLSFDIYSCVLSKDPFLALVLW